MTLFEQINQDIKAAMLAKEKEKLSALRAIKAAFLLAKTEKGDDNLSSEKELSIIQKLVKQRRDSADIYKNNQRLDLAEKEETEANIIATYLPKALSDEELTVIIKEIIKSTGASSMKDMGKVMGIASKQLAGKADGKTISTKVKELINAL
jgi:uncharacterized protein YqeY